MILDLLSAAKLFKPRYDDDPIDRLHYFITSTMLVILAILVSFKQFGGNPIECMIPKMYPGSWSDYAQHFCWSQSTYYVPMDEDVGVPDEEDLRYRSRISYYQWVPFFLLFQAACFRVPGLLWTYLSGRSVYASDEFPNFSMRINRIIELAADPENMRPDHRSANLTMLTGHLGKVLRFHRRLHKKNITPHRLVRPLNLPYTGAWVSFLYIFSKCVFFVNVIIQLILMNYFLGIYEGGPQAQYSFVVGPDEPDPLASLNGTSTFGHVLASLFGHGYHSMVNVVAGKAWEVTGLFPRITFCDVQMRTTGNNVQRHTIQCVLIINMFNEKIFVFLWFWYIMLSILTVSSGIYWAITLVTPICQKSFIARQLQLADFQLDAKSEKKDIQRFTFTYLKRDGVFILRLVAAASGVLIGADLTKRLWLSYFDVEKKYKEQKSATDSMEKVIKTAAQALSEDAAKKTSKGDKTDASSLDAVLKQTHDSAQKNPGSAGSRATYRAFSTGKISPPPTPTKELKQYASLPEKTWRDTSGKVVKRLGLNPRSTSEDADNDKAVLIKDDAAVDSDGLSSRKSKDSDLSNSDDDVDISDDGSDDSDDDGDKKRDNNETNLGSGKDDDSQVRKPSPFYLKHPTFTHAHNVGATSQPRVGVFKPTQKIKTYAERQKQQAAQQTASKDDSKELEQKDKVINDPKTNMADPATDMSTTTVLGKVHIQRHGEPPIPIQYSQGLTLPLKGPPPKVPDKPDGLKPKTGTSLDE